MQFVLKREGIEPKRWEFEPTKLMSVECIEIEKRTGFTFQEWLDKLNNGSMLAIHAFVYVMTKRERPGTKWEDIRFTFEDVDLEATEEELREVRARIQERVESGEASEDELEVLANLPEPVEADGDPKG